MTRGVKAVIAITVVAVIAAIVAWLAVGRDGSAQAEKPPMSSVRPTPNVAMNPATKLTAKAADQLASNLVSRNVTSYRSAWVRDNPPSGAAADTTLTIDVGTFKSQQDIGKVNAVVTQPGKSPETWRLLLQFKNGHWLVYAMEEVK